MADTHFHTKDMHLETKRLIIREFTQEDLDELAAILADPKVMEFSVNGRETQDQTKKLLNHKILDHYKAHGYGLWAVVLKKSHKVIGYAGPIQQEIDGETCVEIGYRLASSQWGLGFCSEALRAIFDYFFLHFDLEKVIAIIDPKNERSLRVAKKVGYKFLKTATFHGNKVEIYEMARVSVADYSPDWKGQFEDEKKKLETIFEGVSIVFEHIGSTSIPNCSAKPKIDILGVVDDIFAIDHFNQEMEKIGYTPMGEFGMKQRRFFTRAGPLPINLHIFENDNPEIGRHRRFCQFLRAHPELTKEYSALKQALTKKHPGNIYEYCLGKEAFVKRIDYQAALENLKEEPKPLTTDRKAPSSNQEILRAMDANIHLHMTYFAKYLPNIRIVFQPDVTIVLSKIPDDTFNYVINAAFKKYQMKERVKFVLTHYQKQKIPFSWWIKQNKNSGDLEKELNSQGLTQEEESIGMYLPIEANLTPLTTSKISIQRVLGKEGLRDFAQVFADLGGYQKLYRDLYSQLPLSLISAGSPYQMYVGYLDGMPVVTGVLVLHAHVGGIYYLMTTPEKRDQGFGTYMMEHLIRQAKEQGYHMITLQASAKGIGLYKRLGFKPLCQFVEYK